MTTNARWLVLGLIVVALALAAALTDRMREAERDEIRTDARETVCSFASSAESYGRCMEAP